MVDVVQDCKLGSREEGAYCAYVDLEKPSTGGDPWWCLQWWRCVVGL